MDKMKISCKKQSAFLFEQSNMQRTPEHPHIGRGQPDSRDMHTKLLHMIIGLYHSGLPPGCEKSE